jgi:hypothetical protein
VARVISVTALPKFRIALRLEDGTAGEVDLSDRLFGSVFEPLARDPELFRSVTVDEFGAVCWPNGADLAPDALYRQVAGTTVGTR